MARRIGFFDSGIGGFSLLLAMRARLPQVEVYYFADHKFLPYGDKTDEELEGRGKLISNFLLQQGVDCIVVACNTATVSTIDKLREQFCVPFVGVEPFVKAVTKLPVESSERLGLLLTQQAGRSRRLQNLINTWDKDGRIELLPVPGLVPLIEEFHRDEDRARLMAGLAEELVVAQAADVSSFILGCTHYPLIQPQMEQLLQRPCVSPGPAVAEQIQKVLGLNPTPDTNPRGRTLFCSHLNGTWQEYDEKDLTRRYQHILATSKAWPT